MLLFILLFQNIFALELKIATPIPEKSTLGQEIAKFPFKTKIRFLFSGIAGSDAVILEGVFKQKLDGAILSGGIISDIDPDIRENEACFKWNDENIIPEVARKASSPEKYFEKKSLRLLGVFDLGWIYLFSKTKKKPFIAFLPHKDPVVTKCIKKTTSNLKDANIVLASLSHFANFPDRKSYKYTNKKPFAYGAAYIFLSQNSYKKIPAKDRKIIEQDFQNLSLQLKKISDQDNQKSFDTLKKEGQDFFQLISDPKALL